MLNTYKLAYIGFEISTLKLTRIRRKNIIYVEKQGHTVIQIAPSSDQSFSSLLQAQDSQCLSPQWPLKHRVDDYLVQQSKQFC